MINIVEYNDIETRWIAIYVKNGKVTYCDTFYS